MQLLTDYLLPFLVILTVLVFVHEWGHYWIAKRAGVKVEVFSIGFGPELFGWTAKDGTRWKFCALPLGGYVKMFGDMNPASVGVDDRPMTPEERKGAFQYKSLPWRAAIVAGGPAANFLFAILILTGLFTFVGQPVTPAVIGAVIDGAPAASAGLTVGDKVLSVDGERVERFEDIQRIVQTQPGVTLPMTVERGGQQVSLSVTTGVRTVEDRFGGTQRLGYLGIGAGQGQMVKHDPLTAGVQAVKETWTVTTGTLHAIGQMIRGERDTKEVGGVLRIAQMSGEVARTSVVSVIWFLALLSINLGLINLMPVPVLDGGHLMYYGAEAVLRRPLGKRVQEVGAAIGLTAILGLMIFATWNDLVQLRIFAWVASLV
ncbi:zinc metalloprotease [Elstera cyanobacteriorum]|uniref:Zinc metalloprotease n=1 Tax=Elstera cyanobacteriorum TaxID=2022747 RepID=A0A255XN72_9PROT|nr:RIP metalloprotease RseP [Elstera cyanobacteriorum]OYQ18428.1 RIP metalloprotease RseP [Elstera cyanobacteriorum]GFZ80329.1 zinc metalloprotease [Elstera cyanobacteriorum]